MQAGEGTWPRPGYRGASGCSIGWGPRSELGSRTSTLGEHMAGSSLAVASQLGSSLPCPEHLKGLAEGRQYTPLQKEQLALKAAKRLVVWSLLRWSLR